MSRWGFQAKSESCGQTHADQKVGELSLGIFIHTHVYTLQGTNIFHLGKRKNIFESAFKRGQAIILPLFFLFGGSQRKHRSPHLLFSRLLVLRKWKLQKIAASNCNRRHLFLGQKYTIPKTNRSPLKIKEMIVFQASIFRCYVSCKQGNAEFLIVQ